MKIVEIGEIVRYNGYIGMGYGYSEFTKRLMKRLKREYFYRFKVGNNYDFWCPFQSFDKQCARDLLIEKYNLR